MDAILFITGEPPARLELGIDCYIYETGSKFKGISVIPSGLHFLYYGTGLGPRQGFFFRAQPGEVIVCTWDASSEEILPRHSLSEASFANLKRSILVGEQNAHLGPYPVQQHHLWLNISCFITEKTLERADCSPGSLLVPGDETDTADIKLIDASKKNRQRKVGAREQANNGKDKGSSDGNYNRKTVEVQSIAHTARFLDVNGINMFLIEKANASQSASAVTAMMIDKSILVQHIVQADFNGDWSLLMGEMQLAFLLFMLLYSYPALQHWKLLINTICSSESFLTNQTDFTSAFMKVLFSQLKFSPDDFFETELSRSNFLRPVLTSLFSSLSGRSVSTGTSAATKQTNRSASVEMTLREHQHRLLTFVQKKFGLLLHKTVIGSAEPGHISNNNSSVVENQFNINDDDDDEDQPIVVSAEELNEAMKRIDMSTFVSTSATRRVNKDESCVDADDLAGDNDHVTETNSISIHAVNSLQNGGEGAAMHGNSGMQALPATSSVSQRWATIDYALGATAAVTFNNVESTSEAHLITNTSDSSTRAVTHAAAAAATDGGGAGVVELKLAPGEIESHMFGWRYPLLHAATYLNGPPAPPAVVPTAAVADDDTTTASTYSAAVFGAEDMTMAAMRIISSFEECGGGGSASSTSAYAKHYGVSGSDDVTAAAEDRLNNTENSCSSNSNSNNCRKSSSIQSNLLYQEAMRFIVDEVSIRKSD